MRTDSKFIAGIQKWFNDNTNIKYWKGVESHGGKIWRKSCLPHLREELMDAITYLAVVEDQHDKAIVLLGTALVGENDNDWLLVQKAYNILKEGNVDDIVEEELEETPNNSLAYKEIKYG